MDENSNFETPRKLCYFNFIQFIWKKYYARVSYDSSTVVAVWSCKLKTTTTTTPTKQSKSYVLSSAAVSSVMQDGSNFWVCG